MARSEHFFVVAPRTFALTSILIIALTALWAAPTTGTAGVQVPVTRCDEGSGNPTRLSPPPLPALITGRVAFYAGLYPPNERSAKRSVSLGDRHGVFPTASMFKTLTVYALMRGVENREYNLTDRLTTTPDNQSIEAFPSGVNSLQRLSERAIHNSDNTANDLLQLAVGPRELSGLVSSLSRCTTVLLTTKAWWAAQAGLLPETIGEDTLAGARTYAALPAPERVTAAARIIAESMNIRAKPLEAALETYFHGSDYTSEVELLLQNTTTPQAYADLLARIMPARELTRTRSTFRKIMTTGCCIPKPSRLTPTYRAAKAGSGWRVLTLSGYLELANGNRLAYTYMNIESQTLESEDMERQIRPINAWIERAIEKLL